MRRRRDVLWRRGLLVRVYLHGLLLLAASGAAVAAVAKLFVEPAMRRDLETLDAWMVARACELRADPARLDRELATYRDRLRLQLALYDAGGALVATAAPPAPRGASAAGLGRGQVRRLGAAWFVAGCHDEAGGLVGYGVGRRVLPQLTWAAPAAALLAALGLLALASVPLARSIAAPLERLAEAARSFGRGDLRARARLRRPDEIGDVALAFDDMAERIAALVRAEKELLANVSHELRTPLARTRVVLELAADGDAAAARGYLPEIAQDLGELERVVDDVMTAARLDLAEGRAGAEGPPLHLRAVPLGDLVGAAAARFREAHPGRALVVAVDPALPAVVVDPVLVRRALDNLLDNARKYSAPPAPVELRAGRLGDRALVEVRDGGIGIDEADLPHLFTPFFRTDRSRARATGGIGLGLALTRRIVAAHGGDIRVDSRPGEGTTVAFTLPALPSP